ncbi:MAG: DMT family transporter [Kiloniellaceae bacterium]
MANSELSRDGTAQPLPLAGFVLLGGITLFWGLQWPVMKTVLTEMPVWSFRSLCLIVGGTALLSIAKLTGQQLRVPVTEIRPLLFCTLFNVIGWHLFSGYGLTLIAAGRASIIAFTMPIWAALLSTLVLGERLTTARLAGLALGMVGLGVLIGPDLRAFGAAPLGGLFMLGAALSWASGTVAMKRFSWSVPPAVLAGWQLIAGSIPITLGAVLFEPIPDLGDLSGRALAALAYTLTFAMVFCHWAWFTVVRLFPAMLASTGTLAIPVVGVMSSGLLLGEAVGLREILSLGLVCTALAVVLVLPALRRNPAA